MKMAKKKIDWEQRRYEMAKTLLPKMIELNENESTTINELVGCVFDTEKTWARAIARLTLEYVDEMLLKLKYNELRLD